MRTALIGYTGFVGSNLASQYNFDDLYNSSNISEIRGKSYDLIVSAANRAEMWRINQNPEADLAEIKAFIEHLRTVKTKKLVLISTVGVYKNPVGVNEDTIIETANLAPYGVNRYYLEHFCNEHFDTLIIRLPGLFGKGIKKNVIFDLLNDNNVDRINGESSYQYYNLERLWHDIKISLDNGLKLVNFATEPITTSEMASQCFGIELTSKPTDSSPASYDMHTKHANIFSGTKNYAYSKRQVTEDIKAFIKTYKSSH